MDNQTNMKDILVTKKWKEIFGCVLKLIFSLYNLTDAEFAARYECDVSTARNWKTARSFPSKYFFDKLKEYIIENAKEDETNEPYLFKELEAIFKNYECSSTYIKLKQETSKSVQLVVNILQYCWDAGKRNITMPAKTNNVYPCEGRTWKFRKGEECFSGAEG